ncbi:hypothetical protein NDU88_003174 [Pleurodeles waltl]|uniref:Uncharacterized protein n=1 Tax=Pleurodeles waltl TaxID=8319 RepID=A0AAV7TMV9_PLEWA|nr:hypothetical protein NDU88_003174 [Pleurodeles waltl]
MDCTVPDTLARCALDDNNDLDTGLLFDRVVGCSLVGGDPVVQVMVTLQSGKSLILMAVGLDSERRSRWEGGSLGLGVTGSGMSTAWSAAAALMCHASRASTALIAAAAGDFPTWSGRPRRQCRVGDRRHRPRHSSAMCAR